MPPRINSEKCNGCHHAKESMCEMVCPGDLLYRRSPEGPAVCRKERDCWDCMACAKACPQKAIEIKIPYQLGYYDAKLIPETSRYEIKWTCIDIYGNKEVFHLKRRNHPQN